MRVLGDSVERGAAFQHLEAVGRHQHAFRRLVHAMIGTADALQHARGALRRADIDDQIDVAPVDAEIERGRANHGAQAARRHRGFYLAPLRHVERAVMQGDGEIVVVDVPKILKNTFGLAARVDKDQRGAMRLDERINLAQRIARRMTGPRHAFARVEHGDIGRCAGFGDDEVGERGAAALRHHETAQVVGLGHGRRQPDAGEVRRQAKQPRQAEREQIATFRSHQGVQLIKDHALERAEQIGRVGGGQEQRQLLRRGEQNLRRIAALALALGARRIAGARLDADRQPHLGNRRFQIARDIDGKRLERRNVERVQAAVAADAAAGGDELSYSSPACGGGRRAKLARRGQVVRAVAPKDPLSNPPPQAGEGIAAQLHQARQETRQGLAAAGRCDQQH